MSKRFFKDYYMATSCSDDPVGRVQPGGTCTVVTNNIVRRTITNGEDESDMGRWSYIQIPGSDQRKIMMITGTNHVCRDNMGITQ